jgi:hypothetical protein
MKCSTKNVEFFIAVFFPDASKLLRMKYLSYYFPLVKTRGFFLQGERPSNPDQRSLGSDGHNGK